jgi:hypothetical protein
LKLKKIHFSAQNERVLLQSISSITLYRGEYTTGRRSAPLPQLECIGGTANGRFLNFNQLNHMLFMIKIFT